MSLRSPPAFLLRFSIIFFLQFALYTSVVFYIYYLESSYHVENIADQERGMLRTVLALINDTVNPIRNDLGFLVDFCQERLAYSDPKNLNSLHVVDIETTFKYFSNNHPIYDQVRFLDITGQEVVRVNYQNGKARIVDKDLLQNKAARYYFRDTIALDGGDVFISPLDLNIENRQIERPFKPMIRIGRVVLSKGGEKLGVVILNYKAQQILDRIHNWDKAQPGDLMLLNSNGYWLHAKNSEWNWGFMFPERSDYCFAALYPELWHNTINRDESGQLKTERGMYTFTTVHPLQKGDVTSTGAATATGESSGVFTGEEYYWKLVSEIQTGELSALLAHLLEKLLAELVFGLLVIGIISAFISHILLKKMAADRALKLANEQLEDNVNKRTQELSYRNLQLQEEMERRLETERQLATSEEQYRTIMEGMDDDVYVVSSDYRIIYSNPKLQRRLVKGALSCYAALYERTTPCPWCVLKEVLDGEKITYELCSPLDHRVYHSSNVPIAYKKNTYGKLTIVRDITDIRRTEQNLMTSEKRYMMLMDTMREGFIVLDPDGIVSYCNHRFSQMLDYHVSEIIGSHFSKFLTDSEIRNIEQQLEKRRAGNTDPYELRWQKHSGEHLLTTVSPGIIKGDSGQYAGSFALITDITEQKSAENAKALMEKQLQQAQKMEALGTLAGGIAHDFNNILAAILGFAELARLDVVDGTEMAEDLDQVLIAARRACELVSQILTFSRQTTHQLIPLSIDPIAKEVMKLMRAVVSSTIAIELTIAEGTGKVMADPAQIHQVVLNLCTNGCQALGENGGRLQVDIFQADSSGREDMSGHFVALVVGDNGPGMPASVVDKIFEPFFTTKEVGKGTGLGLAVVHSIIQDLQGTIKVESEEGKGTRFEILLPATNEDSAEDALHQRGEELKYGAKEHVIWIDDEAPLVSLGCQILESLNYCPQGFTDVFDCIEAIRKNPGLFSLVVSDYNMPQLNGLQLTKRIREIRSDIPVVICTGYSEKLSKMNIETYGIEGFLMKPVGRYQLAAAIHDILH